MDLKKCILGVGIAVTIPASVLIAKPELAADDLGVSLYVMLGLGIFTIVYYIHICIIERKRK